MGSSVLVVDDTPAFLAVIEKLLTAAGYRVRTAGSYEAARVALLTERPDALVVDVRLGEFNGLQLIALTDPLIPAIVLTGHDDVVLAEYARRLGAEFFVKPIAAEMLIEAVGRLLPSSRATAHQDRKS